MLLFLLAYLGGVLTIVSPCILPVLPFVFARADQPFVRSGLPLLVGMAVTFALIATLAAFGGGWAVRANEYGRDLAIALLAIFGVVLLFPALADWLTRPLVALGARLSASAEQGGNGGSRRHLASARRRDRSALGAVRRSDTGPDPDGRRAARRQRADDAVARWLTRPVPQPRWRWRCWSAAAFSRR